MIRTFAFSAAMALGLATAADAAILPLPIDNGDAGIVNVAEGCGAGFWRGPHGHCNRFAGPGGSYRGTHIACPPGMHIGRYDRRCWR